MKVIATTTLVLAVALCWAAPEAALAQADLNVVKTESPDPVLAGNNITYTITVSNSGPRAAQNVALTDNVPFNTTGVSFTQTSGPAFAESLQGGVARAATRALASGATATFSLVVRVNPSTSGSSTIQNTVSVSSITSDPNTTDNSDTETTSVDTSADLSIVKTDTPDPVTAGSNLSYTLFLTNDGPSDAQNVSLQDVIPTNTTFVSATQTSGPAFTLTTPPVGGTGTFTATRPALAAGATATFTLVVNVNPQTPGGANITNSATVSSPTSDPNLASNSDTEVAGVETQANLSVLKTDSPDPANANSNATYTLQLLNNGPSDAQDVSLQDVIPANTTFVSATQTSGPAFTLTSPPVGGTGTFTAAIGTLAAGAAATFELVVKVNAAAAPCSTISNTASASTSTTDPDPANNSDTETTRVGPCADLLVTKADAPDPLAPGANITYSVHIQNNGPGPAPSVSLTDAVPANTTFVSATQNTGPAFTLNTPPAGGTGTISATIASLASGAAADFTFVVRVNSGAASCVAIDNTAGATTTGTDPNGNNNGATTTTTTEGCATGGTATGTGTGGPGTAPGPAVFTGPAATTPSNRFDFGQVTSRNDGSADFVVNVSGPGRLQAGDASAPAPASAAQRRRRKRRRALIRAVSATATRAGPCTRRA